MTDLNNLYVMRDGTHSAKGDLSKGDDGVLRNKNGIAVATWDNGEPHTVGGDAVANMNVEAANAGKVDEAKKAEGVITEIGDARKTEPQKVEPKPAEVTKPR